jgi:CysZ protein
MRKILGGFGLLAGATYPFRSLGFFWRTPRLWGYLIVPILINIVIGIGLYGGLLFFGWETLQDLMLSLSNWVEDLSAKLPALLKILEFIVIGLGLLLRLVLILGLFIFTGFVLLQFGVLLGAPWYGKLSEQLEELRTGQLFLVEVSIIQDIWRSLLFELKKLVLIAVVGIPLLLLNFAPPLGTIAASVGGIALTATIVCLDFLDAPLERRRLRFREKLRIVWESFPASASFSLVCLLLIGVPLLNLVTVPLCVASGTLFFCDRIWPKRFARLTRTDSTT